MGWMECVEKDHVQRGLKWADDDDDGVTNYFFFWNFRESRHFHSAKENKKSKSLRIKID